MAAFLTFRNPNDEVYALPEKKRLPKIIEELHYVIEVFKDGNGFGGRFKSRPKWQPESNGPLAIEIREDCKVYLELDTSVYDCEFDRTQAVRLHHHVRPGDRYQFLEFPDKPKPNERCLRVCFEAARLYFGEPVSRNTDWYEFNILVHGEKRSGKVFAVPIPQSVDPEIKNPGDNGSP